MLKTLYLFLDSEILIDLISPGLAASFSLNSHHGSCTVYTGITTRIWEMMMSQERIIPRNIGAGTLVKYFILTACTDHARH